MASVATATSSAGRRRADSSESAPPSYSSPPPPQKMRLYDSARERQKYSEMADLYCIIKATEHLERAYVRDAVGKEEYTEACAKLIAQFKGARVVVGDVHEFIREYKVECPRAMNRLLREGVPATVLTSDHSTKQSEVKVAETVHQFITVLDALKLNVRAVDEISPLVRDLLGSISRTPGLPDDFEAKTKVHKWILKFNEMEASDEISEEQERQLAYDIDTSYAAYYRWLESH